MIAALGLSPAEPRPQQASTFEPRLSPSATVALHSDGPRSQPKDELKNDTGSCLTCAPASKEPSEKNLPALPIRLPTPPTVSNMKDSSLPSIPVSETMLPSIRPVSEENAKPILPKIEHFSIDLSAPDVPVEGISPEVLPKDISSPKEEEHPPSLPPKDMQPRGVPSQGVVSPKPRFAARQLSVSTLGLDEQRVSHPLEGEVDTPPSPLQQPGKMAQDDMPDHHAYDQSSSRALVSDFTLPSLDDVAPGFGSTYPHRPPTSAEILESKRKSISGLPPSTPIVHSPLRNEVRYSPGTRSSILSFGSFGRQSNNSKGTRPNTPANEMSEHAASGDSRMDKLKNFGRRRRASVGNALSGLQDGFSKELQGLQARGAESESQPKEGGQKKRPFNRISVCDIIKTKASYYLINHLQGFFGRQQEPQPAQSKAFDFGADRPAPMKALPTAPQSSQPQDSFRHNGNLTIDPVDKDLPPPPVSRSSFSSVESSNHARDPRQRASLPLPPVTATNPMLTSRFYSSFQSEEPPTATQHTRTKSQPMLSPPPLSPIGGSDSDKSNQSIPLSDVSQVEERTIPQEHEHEDAPPPVPPKSPEIQPQPEQDPNLPKDVPDVSIFSTYPHRGDARLVNETHEPVELAVTHDDSSEEIIMSPTSYPGQEWTPTDYY